MRCAFFKKYKKKLTMDSVVAGDFNATLSQIDRSGKSKHVHDKAVKYLLNIMNDKQLYDEWINRKE